MTESSPQLFSEKDLKVFASEICAGDEEIFLELLEDCQSDLKQHLANLVEARSAKDWKTFNRSAHTLKSTARTFGSPSVADLAFQLEKLSEDGVAEDDLDPLDSLTLELEKTSKQFSSILADIAKNPSDYVS